MVNGTGCKGASGAKSSRIISRSSFSVIPCSLERLLTLGVFEDEEDGAVALFDDSDSLGALFHF
jgi:hypothetical protein